MMVDVSVCVIVCVCDFVYMWIVHKVYCMCMCLCVFEQSPVDLPSLPLVNRLTCSVQVGTLRAVYT